MECMVAVKDGQLQCPVAAYPQSQDKSIVKFLCENRSRGHSELPIGMLTTRQRARNHLTLLGNAMVHCETGILYEEQFIRHLVLMSDRGAVVRGDLRWLLEDQMWTGCKSLVSNTPHTNTHTHILRFHPEDPPRLVNKRLGCIVSRLICNSCSHVDTQPTQKENESELKETGTEGREKRGEQVNGVMKTSLHCVWHLSAEMEIHRRVFTSPHGQAVGLLPSFH